MGKNKDLHVDAVSLILELREVISEGNALLKDMAAERKLLAAERKHIEDMYVGLPARVDENVTERIMAHLEVLGRETEEAMGTAVERVHAKFDELYAALIGHGKYSRRANEPSLEVLAHALVTIDAARATPPKP